MTIQSLPKHLRALCGRVAHERTRAICWQQAQDLRRETLERLSQADAGAVEQWLVQELEQALVVQAQG